MREHATGTETATGTNAADAETVVVQTGVAIAVVVTKTAAAAVAVRPALKTLPEDVPTTSVNLMNLIGEGGGEKVKEKVMARGRERGSVPKTKKCWKKKFSSNKKAVISSQRGREVGVG